MKLRSVVEILQLPIGCKYVSYPDALIAVEQARREFVDAIAGYLLLPESKRAGLTANPLLAVDMLVAKATANALDPITSSAAEALIERGRREEREACAKIADGFVKTSLITMAEQIAAAIRARGETK